MAICSCCGEQLNKSQYRQNREYKSCPKCSTNNGKEHIYYPYSSYFGTSEKRKTPNVPDGAQSYCTRCRGDDTGPYAQGIKCSDFK